jgi:shikimate dehydrogenase
MQITGRTRVFYCMADPIDQVRAPEVFNEVFARHEVDAVMVPMRVHAPHLEATLQMLFESPTVGGVSLSIPHKTAGAAIVDRCSPAASVADAVNAIRRIPAGGLEGELFDGEGFRRSPLRWLRQASRKSPCTTPTARKPNNSRRCCAASSEYALSVWPTTIRAALI